MSLADHNARNPSNVLPEIVVVIDNFAEFKESYEHLVPELMALVRDGRAFGIYFVITATVPNDLPGKLYSLFTVRMTLTQNDPTMYSEAMRALCGHTPRSGSQTPKRYVLRT